MHDLDLILTLTGGLAAALFFGFITHKIGLSPIVGYLIAGVLVGPNTPGFEADVGAAKQFAEIGVILLMFGVGLHFHFKELLAVRRVAVPGAMGQILAATLLGMLLGVSFGWTWQGGMVFGLAISVASTVVLLRVLADNNDLHTPTGHIAVGWLVVEDLFTVLVLVLLPVIFPAPAVTEAAKAAVDHVAAPAAADSNVWIALAWAIVKIALLVVFVMVVGGRVIPWLLARVAITRSRELFTLTVLVLALGIAVGAAKWFGVSMALGAFLAGMIVGQSDFSSRAAADALPMRDAFAVLFFVSVGMLFNPMYFVEAPVLVAATLAIVLIGKPLAALAIVLFLNYPLRVALAVAVALAQIGEFSFILAELGTDLKILDASANSALIAAAIVSISINPLLYRLIDWMEDRAKKSPALSKWLNARAHLAIGGAVAHDESDAGSGCAVVVGFGPVGRTLVRMLQENDIKPVVIEMNLETVRRLREEGIAAVYGDATHRETMKEASADRAIALILTSAGMHGCDETIRIARELNPRIKVFARATYLREVPALRHAGADVVFSSEGEVAMRMTEFLLEQLGATGEQIDREVDRIRDELFGSPATIELLLPLPPKPASEPTANLGHAQEQRGS